MNRLTVNLEKCTCCQVCNDILPGSLNRMRAGTFLISPTMLVEHAEALAEMIRDCPADAITLEPYIKEAP